MAHLQESPIWEEKIYRLQANIDSPVGGRDGITNLQPTQIANRTRWLLAMMAREHSLTGHLISADQVSETANIDADKALLDVSFDELNELLSQCGTSLMELTDRASETIGRDGRKFDAIVRAQLFLWEKGGFNFGWEFFTDGLNMRQFLERPIISTVHTDDTIILEDVSGISLGDTMIAYSGDGSDTEIFTVGRIIRDSSTGQYRILAADGLQIDRDSGFIGSMSWQRQERGGMLGVPGSLYLSEEITALNNAESGLLIIHFLPGSGTAKVEASRNGAAWEVIDSSSTEDRGDKGYAVLYDLEPGIYRLRVSCDGTVPTQVGYMAVIPRIGTRTVAPIRKPVVVAPNEGAVAAVDEIVLESSVFRRAYGDVLAYTEFSISPTDGIPMENTPIWVVNDGIKVDTTDPEDAEGADLTAYLDSEEDGERVFPYGAYFIRCRHVSDVGDVSEWSDPVIFSLARADRTFGMYNYDPRVEPPRRIGGFDNSDTQAEDVTGTPGEYSGKFRSLADESYTRFGFNGTTGTLGFDQGMFNVEKRGNSNG